MEKFGVPCPQCGSVRVVVRDRVEPPRDHGTERSDVPSRAPQVHRCSCENCRHTFRHDFAFTC